jgi:hypothetical protein
MKKLWLAGVLAGMFLPGAHADTVESIHQDVNQSGGSGAMSPTDVASPKIDSYDAAQVPSSVYQAAKAIPWTPKLKKLGYTYTYLNLRLKKNTQVHIDVEALEDDTLNICQTFAPKQTMQVVSVAGIAPLKVRMHHDGGERDLVLVTTGLKITFPQRVRRGERIVLDETRVSSLDGVSHDSIVCDIGDSMPAKQIYPALTGEATQMACRDSQVPDEVKTVALLQDFGLVVGLKLKNAKMGESEQKYTQFTVEK